MPCCIEQFEGRPERLIFPPKLRVLSHMWDNLKMEVIVHSAAEPERPADKRERAAMSNAIEKLKAMGAQLGFPHTSAWWVALPGYVSSGRAAGTVRGVGSTEWLGARWSSGHSGQRRMPIPGGSTPLGDGQRSG